MSEQNPNLFNQVDQQIANGQPATVLVERSNGDITTAQVAGIGTEKTNAFLGNLTVESEDNLPYKPVGNEKLTDGYQEYLAKKLAGTALRESGVENDVPAAPEPKASPDNGEKMRKARTEADYKYNPVKYLGGTHEEAEAAAERVWKHYGF